MRIILTIISLLFVAASIFIIAVDGLSWESFAILLFWVIVFLIHLFSERLKKWGFQQQQKRLKASFCKIKKDHFLFPKGYYFKHGYLKNQKQLPYSIIDEIRLNTFPNSAKINGNEIIFLIGLADKYLEELAHQQQIPITNPQDNWSFICEVFLDTEIDEGTQKMTLQYLEEVGISKDEVEQIRKRLKFRMEALTYVTWEWFHYGQYDVLKQFLSLRKKTYWWTMEIALKELQ